jgi:hypothetical protein
MAAINPRGKERDTMRRMLALLLMVSALGCTDASGVARKETAVREPPKIPLEEHDAGK